MWATVHLVMAAAPSVLGAAGALLLLVSFSKRLPPRASDRALEPIIMREQLRRAATVTPDLLILGDSSALMGVDARALGDALDRRVESLATLGWVGPAAHAKMLETVSARTGPLPAVLLLMCGDGLKVAEQTFAGRPFERQVLTGLLPNATPPKQGRLTRVYDRLVMPLIDPPMPGRLGFYYGWPQDVARFMEHDHGGLVDPIILDRGRLAASYRFELSPAVEERLLTLAKALKATRPQAAMIAISPLPQSSVGPLTEGSRTAVLDQMIRAAGLDERAALATPTALPTPAFASLTHLAADGRQTFTRMLADRLRGRVARRGEPAR